MERRYSLHSVYGPPEFSLNYLATRMVGYARSQGAAAVEQAQYVLANGCQSVSVNEETVALAASAPGDDALRRLALGRLLCCSALVQGS